MKRSMCFVGRYGHAMFEYNEEVYLRAFMNPQWNTFYTVSRRDNYVYHLIKLNVKIEI
jgi:hypothetical protein